MALSPGEVVAQRVGERLTAAGIDDRLVSVARGPPTGAAVATAGLGTAVVLGDGAPDTLSTAA